VAPAKTAPSPERPNSTPAVKEGPGTLFPRYWNRAYADLGHRAPSLDLPLEDPADDRLGYVRFSQLIANAIASMAPVDGPCWASTGRAGRRVANFVRRHRRTSATVVSEFNPWRYAADDDITRRYLSALVPVLAPGVDAGGDPAATRAAAAEVLKRERTRHVIVIDDLDRVAPERVAEIGRLVSAVTDLPNVVHLVVLEHGALPESDLERVVQVPFDLPLPEGLTQMLFDDLRALMAANPHSSAVTDEHWDQIFSPGIETLIETPRDIVRLMNVLRLTYPPVCRELNPVDFIAVEAVRCLLPAELTTPSGATHHVPERGGRSPWRRGRGCRRSHDAWAAELPERLREAAQTLILRCFPAVPDSRSGREPRREREHAPGAARREPGAVRRLLPVRRPETTVSERRDGRARHPRRPGCVRGAAACGAASERDSSGALVSGFWMRLR
jgi:predicted KAP-like P-loop ATPase